jgi:hypothetical protein
MVSNEITGSESGPLPTIPGQVALWSFGKLLLIQKYLGDKKFVFYKSSN